MVINTAEIGSCRCSFYAVRDGESFTVSPNLPHSRMIDYRGRRQSGRHPTGGTNPGNLEVRNWRTSPLVSGRSSISGKIGKEPFLIEAAIVRTGTDGSILLRENGQTD